jgi:hypothetical protein
VLQQGLLAVHLELSGGIRAYWGTYAQTQYHALWKQSEWHKREIRATSLTSLSIFQLEQSNWAQG